VFFSEIAIPVVAKCIPGQNGSFFFYKCAKMCKLFFFFGSFHFNTGGLKTQPYFQKVLQSLQQEKWILSMLQSEHVKYSFERRRACFVQSALKQASIVHFNSGIFKRRNGRLNLRTVITLRKHYSYQICRTPWKNTGILWTVQHSKCRISPKTAAFFPGEGPKPHCRVHGVNGDNQNS